MAKKAQLIALIKELMAKIIGKGSEPLVDFLFGKKNVNEFKIADKLKMEINQVRNMLYRLDEAGIMSSTKKKDRRKGWYAYFWTLDAFRALELLQKLKLQEIEALKNQLKSRESRTFYSCEEDGLEMSEETALHHNFLCPECGQLMKLVSKEKKVKEINSRIETIKKALALIAQELEKIKPKAPKLKPELKPRKIRKIKRTKKKKKK